MIVIVDYDTGNLRSVQNMLKYLGHDSAIASTPAEIESASKIILPGVGNFDFGMRSLAERDLIPALNRKVIEQKTPTLGICLGAQLITRGSEEGELPGLGWIPADTKQFDRSRLGADLRVPHMGWADTEFDPNHPLFAGIESIPRYYYVHSFHMVCDMPFMVIALHLASLTKTSRAFSFIPRKAIALASRFWRTSLPTLQPMANKTTQSISLRSS
jgi:glutamine amidotransferase